MVIVLIHVPYLSQKLLALHEVMVVNIQGGPQLKMLACCMTKNLYIVRECTCMCAKCEDPCGWGPKPAQGP